MPRPAPPPAKPVVPPPPARGLVVLVDDDPVFREIARELLDLAGWSVLEFGDGRKFLTWMQDRGVEPRFIILDLKMPGMDGPDVLRELMDMAPHLPVFLCTGLERWQVDESLFRLGRVGWLPKPLASADLAAALQTPGVVATD